MRGSWETPKLKKNLRSKNHFCNLPSVADPGMGQAVIPLLLNTSNYHQTWRSVNE